jgi:hypothetical protein
MTKRSLSMRRARRKLRVLGAVTIYDPASFPRDPWRKSSHNLSGAASNWPLKWSDVSDVRRRREALRFDFDTCLFSQRARRPFGGRGPNFAHGARAGEAAHGRGQRRRDGSAATLRAHGFRARARDTSPSRTRRAGDTGTRRRVSALRVGPSPDASRQLWTLREAARGFR